jgi:hypothetical protein
MANVPGYQPLLTKDTDLAFGRDAPLEGDIKAALQKMGFNEELSGDHRPPVTQYALGEDDAGFYAEFLTPLHGSGVRRNGELDATTLKAGITAQKLRHLEILLINPWPIRIGPEQGIPLARPMDLQVANPASFIVQRLLIQPTRTPRKRAQDMLYIHDALELFGATLSELRSLWQEKIRSTLTKNASRQLTQQSKECFSSVTDVIREAARIPQDRSLDPERMRAACQLALSQILD